MSSPTEVSGVVLRVAASLRLAASAFVLVWASVVAVVVLDTRSVHALPGLALATTAFGLALAPVFTVRVGAGPAGLTVTNGFRSRFVPWGEVADFRVTCSLWAGRVVAVLASGEQMPLRATVMTLFAPGRDRQLELMRAELAGALRRGGLTGV